VTFPTMEGIVRPWTSVTSPRNLTDRHAPAEVLPDATIRWGKSSEFGFDQFRQDAANPGFNTEGDDKKKRVRLNYSGSAAAFRDYRVENPDDPDQYAIVRQASGMALSGPQGEQVILSISYGDPPGTEVGDGQEPPAPPPLSELP
jgi:hypothetical protein